MENKARTIIETIRNDRQSGAARLAITALESLGEWLDTASVKPEELDEVLEALKTARPSMVPLANAVDRCRNRFGDWQNDDVSEQAGAIVAEVHRELTGATDQVARHAAELVPEGAVVLTHSSSSQVVALFRLLVERQHRYSVICSQSSPGNEGFTLASQLDELGVPVTVITDAQLGLFMNQADLAVCGCDSWLADHHFVNKSGSYLMALAARDHGKPLWVLADTFKDSPASRDTVTLEEMDSQELGAPTGVHITTRNVYFEPVPERLAAGRVSEQGVSSFPAGPRR